MGCIGLSPSDPSRKSWAAQELGSKSTLDRIDEEAHPHWSSEIVNIKPDYKHESTFDSGPDFMKPLPVPGSRTSHIASPKRGGTRNCCNVVGVLCQFRHLVGFNHLNRLTTFG
jgi:hypothetical protein